MLKPLVLDSGLTEGPVNEEYFDLLIIQSYSAEPMHCTENTHLEMDRPHPVKGTYLCKFHMENLFFLKDKADKITA